MSTLSSFDTISYFDEGAILFLQKAVVFEMKRKNDSKRKRRSATGIFHKQEEKRPFNNLAIKLTNGDSFLDKI